MHVQAKGDESEIDLTSSTNLTAPTADTPCKIVIKPSFADCIQSVTHGYHAANKTYTYLKFETGSGREQGEYGTRVDGDQEVVTYRTVDYTCLRGISGDFIEHDGK